MRFESLYEIIGNFQQYNSLSGYCPFFSPTANAESWAVEAFSLCIFLLLPNLREVPHGTKGTGPKFVTRPVYLRSQFRNNTNTVSTLVPLRYIYYRFSVHGTRVSHITGRSRPLGEVGLTPRQYTEWNVVGRARSAGDPSQQGLLPEVYRTASTGRCAHLLDRVLTSQRTINKEPTDPRSRVRVVYIAGDTLRHQPMGANHMTVLQLRGPMVFRVLQWCHPMLASLMEDKLLYPDDHLIWCSKVDSGPRISLPFLVDLPL